MTALNGDLPPGGRLAGLLPAVGLRPGRLLYVEELPAVEPAVARGTLSAMPLPLRCGGGALSPD